MPTTNSSSGHCPNISGCELYPRFQNESMLRFWQITYCESADYARCARYASSKKGVRPSPEMLPNGELLKLGRK